MKYLKLPYYLLVGIIKMILFSAFVMTFPFVLIPVLLIEIGGLNGFSEKVTNAYSRILGLD